MIFEILLLVSLMLAIFAVETKDLLYSVIFLGALGSVIAVLFYLMAAPDIAITQAVVTAGLGTFVLVVAVNRIGRREENK